MQGKRIQKNQSRTFWHLVLGSLLVWLVWCPLGSLDQAALAAPLGRREIPIHSKVTPVFVHLGNPEEELKFFPNRLQFTADQRYKLILDNPSGQKHYFTAKDFADALWTQKVEAGNVEVKGAIHELELKPGAIAEWLFIPQKPGTYTLRCTIPGHAEAGMVGEITVDP